MDSSSTGSSSSTPAAAAAASSAAGGAAAAGAGKGVKAPPRPIPPLLRPFLYLGIPRSVLTWKPKPPSRNMSIFLLTVSTLSYLYYDDRKQCRKLKAHYIAQVQHLAKEPLPPWGYPRKIAVYGAMWPGDDDPDKTTLFFRKYVKPILVAAAIDWEVIHGTRPGGLARDLTSRIFARRRQLAGIEPWSDDLSGNATTPSQEGGPPNAPTNPFALSPQQQLQRELDGAIVILGRPALKEWAYALKTGWSSTLPLERIDADDQLAATLNEDSTFDELPDSEEAKAAAAAAAASGEGSTSQLSTNDEGEADGAGAPLPSRLNLSPTTSFNPAFQKFNLPQSSSQQNKQQQESAEDTIDPVLHPVQAAIARGINPALLVPPPTIPAHAPLVFVDQQNLVGWRQIPAKLIGFFRHRDRVKMGGEAALRIALGTKEQAKDFALPASEEGQGEDLDPFPLYPLTSDTRSEPISNVPTPPPQGGDLDWGLDTESSYPPYYAKTLAAVAKSRRQWYEALPQKLRDTRTLERGQREPTRSEQGSYRPKPERELKQERLEREVEWRAEEHAFGIGRRESGVSWSPRWRGSLRVMPELDDLPLPPAPASEQADGGEPQK
ncbi:mitochondrial import inner membrane translocase subunit tim54 [Tilletia horrida]|nr:mitochondrial import inner membrane translocase subunit tim54 [Tilletia horrida]